MDAGVHAMPADERLPPTMIDKRRSHLATRGPLTGMLSACVLASVLLASGCSSGSGGTDVTIGSGQNMDPVTLDFPVFYVKRPVPSPEEADYDIRRPLGFQPGADLFMRDRASPSAPEINVTGDLTGGFGDVRDVDVNYDGTKIIFSMRIVEDPDADPLPTWNIWEYDVPTRELRRIMTSDTTAEEGHDVMPHYLPDGRIVFSSTRQRQSRAILLDENKPQFAAQVEAGVQQPAFILHVMEADGSNINQITFNQSHDLEPSVLNDGRIVYTHWEQALSGSQFDLYAINPDGTGRELLYGAHSHQTGTVDPQTNQPSTIQFLQPRAMQDGRTLALIRPFAGTNDGGDLVLIDTENFVDNTRGATPATASLTGPAQTRALPTDVRTIPGPSPGGRYRSASPLFDGTNRLLVSWSQCRLAEQGRIVPCTAERLANTANPPVEAPPLYGVYIYDVRDNTQKPVVAPQEGFIYTEVVAAAARPLPPVILPGANSDLPIDVIESMRNDGVGILHIRSVYDVDGADRAPGGLGAVSNPGNPAYGDPNRARFLRLEKVVSQPDDDTRDVPGTAFGASGQRFGMREILGYAPIEPDGSVKVQVPANVAFAISIVDANGRRLPGVLGARHSSWLQVVPGETLTCNGCHDANAQPRIAHGRNGLTESINAGAASTGASFPGANPLLAAFDMGETMAEARSRAMCGTTRACPPSVNIAFDDYWNPAYNPAAPTGSIDLCYETGVTNVPMDPADPAVRHVCMNGLATPPPTPKQCAENWTSLCRITIHYETHIQPLWDLERFVDADEDGMPDLDPVTNEPINNRCTICHGPADAAAVAQVPAGQLDLTDRPSDQEPAHFTSYRELLFGDSEDELVGGVLVERLIDAGIDPVTGNPILRSVPVAASMSAAGARNSTRFFDTLEGRRAPTVNHSDFMSPSELRLLSEWLDIGAQYYNDPFAAPEN
jgi:hypothetical protein